MVVPLGVSAIEPLVGTEVPFRVQELAFVDVQETVVDLPGSTVVGLAYMESETPPPDGLPGGLLGWVPQAEPTGEHWSVPAPETEVQALETQARWEELTGLTTSWVDPELVPPGPVQVKV